MLSREAQCPNQVLIYVLFCLLIIIVCYFNMCSCLILQNEYEASWESGSIDSPVHEPAWFMHVFLRQELWFPAPSTMVGTR